MVDRSSYATGLRRIHREAAQAYAEGRTQDAQALESFIDRAAEEHRQMRTRVARDALLIWRPRGGKPEFLAIAPSVQIARRYMPKDDSVWMLTPVQIICGLIKYVD
jgi:hypothetical protein